LLVTAFLFSAAQMNAQALKASVDMPAIKLGQQFSLKLQLENADAASVSALWNVADTFNTFEVVEVRKADTTGSTINQEFLLTSFDSGPHIIPPFTVVLKDGRRITSNALVVEVTEIDISKMKDYHDIKDVLTPAEPETTWWLLITILAIVFAAMIGMYIFFSRKNKHPAKQKINNNLLDEALQQLATLKQKQYFGAHQHKKYFTELIHIMHSFIDGASNKSTKQLTTAEWMIQLKSFEVNKPTEVVFFQLLRVSDAVKFAKYIPDNNAEADSINTATAYAKALWQLRYNKTFA